MKVSVLLRRLHYWGAALIMLQIGLVIAAGLLLSVKKELTWIQPATQVGAAPKELPSRSLAELHAAATADPRLEGLAWSDFARIDFHPNKGVLKFISKDGWEAQVDTSTGQLLQVAPRRSDLIESLHDGSFFADWTKLFIFFPSGLVLFYLWGSGIYMFVYPRLKTAQKQARRTGRRTDPTPGQVPTRSPAE